jgi:signal transduction histidine kinase
LAGKAHERGGGEWIDIPGASTLYKWKNSRFGAAPGVYWRWIAIYVFLLMLGLLGDFASCAVISLPAFWTEIMPRLHYLAIVFAAVQFAIAGGIASACIAGASHVAILAIACNQADSQAGQLAMFAAVGLTAGWLSERRVASSLERAMSMTPHTEDPSRSVSLSELGRLMPELVHQFRTPIASIEGAGFVLQDSDLPRDKRQEFAGIIRKECRRLELLVELLDFTQSHPSEYRDVDVTRLLDEVIALCRPKTEGRITFRHMARHDMPELRCEPELIKHAIQVVMTIATEAISQNGEIEISTDFGPHEIVITFMAHGDQFSPRLDASMLYDRNVSDLAVVRQIVGRHGGSVRVEGVAGGGVSTFMILPRNSWVGL